MRWGEDEREREREREREGGGREGETRVKKTNLGYITFKHDPLHLTLGVS